MEMNWGISRGSIFTSLQNRSGRRRRMTKRMVDQFALNKEGNQRHHRRKEGLIPFLLLPSDNEGDKFGDKNSVFVRQIQIRHPNGRMAGCCGTATIAAAVVLIKHDGKINFQSFGSSSIFDVETLLLPLLPPRVSSRSGMAAKVEWELSWPLGDRLPFASSEPAPAPKSFVGQPDWHMATEQQRT